MITGRINKRFIDDANKIALRSARQIASKETTRIRRIARRAISLRRIRSIGGNINSIRFRVDQGLNISMSQDVFFFGIPDFENEVMQSQNRIAEEYLEVFGREYSKRQLENLEQYLRTTFDNLRSQYLEVRIG